MKISVINKKSKREVPSFMLHLYINYDEKGNMKCIDDEYEMQFEDEEKDELKWKLNEANEYIDELQCKIQQLEMMVDEDD